MLRSFARDRESNFFATELGLYESDNGLRRLQLTDDGALLTLAEVGERCFAVAVAPDGTLFANVMDAGCQEYVASYDPLTLFANELFVMDSVHDELYNCFHDFSLDGEYLREVLVDGVQSPSAFCFSNGRMYVVDDGSTFDGSTRILVLTNYEHEAFEPISDIRVCVRRGARAESTAEGLGPVRHRAIDSSELRLTTDREGRQVGQHRSHIVAAVSSACLIARAAASGSQGRIVSSLSPGRPRADVGLSAVWSDLSAVSTTDQVGVF